MSHEKSKRSAKSKTVGREAGCVVRRFSSIRRRPVTHYSSLITHNSSLITHHLVTGSLKLQRSVTMSPSKAVVTLYGNRLNRRIMPWFWAEV